MKPKHVTRGEYKALCAQAERLHKDHKDYQKKQNFDFFLYLITVLLLLFSLRTFIGEPVQVVGSSMHPTLRHSERMIVEKVSYWFRAPQRGEIIICYYPGFTESCVKRVIGLPGDTVEVVAGILFVNGEPLDERDYWNDYIEDTTAPVTVPENSLFVVGDNRNHSDDSRIRSIGCIPYERVVGRVMGVFWPVSNARWVEMPTYGDPYSY